MKKTTGTHGALSLSLLSLLLTVLYLVPGANTQIFAQDVTLHETTTSSGMMGRGATNTTSATYISSNAMKITSSDGNDVIIRIDSGKIISIDNNKKTYSEMTFQQLQAMFDKISAEMGKNQEQMEAMKKMMGQMSADFAVTKEGPGETIAGYSTEKYLLKGPMEMELWAAPDLKVPAQYYDAMKLRMPRNPMFDMGKMFDEMKKINGMALKNITTMKMMNMEMKTTKIVTSVDKSTIPASTFEVPAGYKLIPNNFDMK